MILPLHLLLVADDPAESVLDALRRAGYDPRPHYAATPKAVGAALERRAWDVVLVCPEWGGASVWEVLGWVQRRPSPPPLFVVADSVGTADTVALIEEGVYDVVETDQLDRLGVAVARAMRGRRERASSAPSERSEDAFYALAEHMPVGLYRSTEDGRILFANPALARMLGRASVEDLLGEPIVGSLKYPREDFVRQIAETGEVRDFEMRWRRADGHEIVTCETARAVYDAEGVLLYYEGTMEDVTEERRALDSERRRVEQLEAIVQFSTSVDAAQSSDDLYRAVVRVVEETMHADVAVLVGRSDDEFDIQAWSESIPHEEVEACRDQEVWKTYAFDTSPALVRDERRVKGARLAAPVRAFMQRNGLRALGSFPLLHRGHPLGALVVFLRQPHTFTEGELRMAETLAWHVAGALSRWQAEAELRDSEATLRTITDTTGHVPYRLRFGADAYDHLSPSIERLTGYTPEQLRAAGGLDALTETYRVIAGGELKEGWADDGHYLALHHLRTVHGDLRWVEDSAYPWVDESGRTIGLAGVLRDVTERHEREAAAREQTQRSLTQQRALNELSALDVDVDAVLHRTAEVAARTTETDRVGFWLLDEEAGEMACHALYALAEAEHRAERAPAVPAAACVALLRQHRAIALADLHERPLDSALGLGAFSEHIGIRALLTAPIRRQGQVVGFVTFAQLGAARMWTLDEQDFAGAVADLAALTLEREQRARAEEALRESERRYRAISTLAADYAYAVRVEPGWATHLEWATDAFERITGYEPEEVTDAEGLFTMVHEHDRPMVRERVRELAAGQTIELEMRIATKGGQERWICHRSSPVLDAQGRLRYVYSTGQDVTDRKRFEEALVEAREQAEEMARNKSTFLANMSHEIRTPLTGIIGFAGVLAEEVEGEHREFVHLIERSGRRLLATINSVLDLAQLESDGLDPTPEALDVVEEARQAVLLLSSLAEKKGLALRLRAEAEEVTVAADPTCLHRVFNNLIGNAIKFTDEGEVGVEIQTEQDRVRIEVWDTGVGIDAVFLPHLFSEFRQESKKNEHEGSGLGLAITKKLVEMMGGEISVESTKGEGSRFTITLPLLAGPPAERAPERDDAPEEAPEDAVPPRDATEGPRADAMEDVLDPATLTFHHPLAPTVGGESDEQGNDSPVEPSQPEPAVVETDEAAPAPGPLDSDAVPTGGGMEGDGASDEPAAYGEALPPAEAAADAPRVLVVTDDEEVRDRLQTAAEGCAVEVVAEARAALDRMTKGRYDALVLDVNLGGKQTGVGVLRVARTLPGYDGAFAVALTAEESERDSFIEAGFDYCLSEPLTHQALLDVLSRASTRVPSA